MRWCGGNGVSSRRCLCRSQGVWRRGFVAAGVHQGELMGGRWMGYSAGRMIELSISPDLEEAFQYYAVPTL